MQQIELRSSSTKTDTGAFSPARPAPLFLTFLDRVVMAGLVAAPLVFAAIIYLYCLALERFSWPALLSALKMLAVLLLCYQFSAGANGLVQIAFSLRRIRNNTLRRRTSRFELV